MDLLATVRKEGSRGGRADFKWEDVKADQHRENYLGHSLMAPVGRWQKNKDLSWYAKTNADGTQQTEADARKEEIRRVKEAEADALARALGYDVPVRPVGGNANMTQLGERDAQRVVKESVAEEEKEAEQEAGGKGLGYGGFAGARGGAGADDEEIMEGANTGRGGLDKHNGEGIRRDIETEDKVRKERRRDRSRDGERRAHRHRREDDGDRRRRPADRSRSRSRDRRKRLKSREHRPRDDRPRDDRLREDRRERGERSHRDDRRPLRNTDRPRDTERTRHRSRSRSPHERNSRHDRRGD